MSPRRKVRASELTSTGREKNQWSFFIIFILVGGFFLLYMYRWHADDDYDRFDKAREYAEYYKEFFVENPLVYTVFGDMTLMIRATNLGVEYWDNDFPSKLAKTENEVSNMIRAAERLNERDPDERLKNKEVDLSSFPEIIDILEMGKDISKNTLFNIAAGEIFDFWDIALRRKKLPDFDNLRPFIPFADPERIEIDREKGIVRINSVNTGVKPGFFREALFLKKLKEKLPRENFNYLIFLGDRHGMWFLPEKYIRWTVSIESPFDSLRKVKGALRLMPEEGFFVITRSLENQVVIEKTDISAKIRENVESLSDDSEKRAEYVKKIRQKYPSPFYVFNPVDISLNRIYSLPVDWRTGMPVEKNAAAIVIDSDPLKARMLSYSLYISDDDEVSAFTENWPDINFAILRSDNTIYIPENTEDIFLTAEEVEQLRIEHDYRRRGLNPDGSTPDDKKGL